MNACITSKIHKIIGMLWMKAKAIPKESLRAQPDKSKSTNNNIAFITTYNPSHPDTFKYITSLKEGLRGSTKM